MSRTTKSIRRINLALNSIGGLGGIVSDIMEEKANEIERMVEYIKKEHSEASLFNHYGRTSIDNILDTIGYKTDIGYASDNLKVGFGKPEYQDGEEVEGYYLMSDYNGYRMTITGALAVDEDVDRELLIKELDKLGVDYLF